MTTVPRNIHALHFCSTYNCCGGVPVYPFFYVSPPWHKRVNNRTSCCLAVYAREGAGFARVLPREWVMDSRAEHCIVFSRQRENIALGDVHMHSYTPEHINIIIVIYYSQNETYIGLFKSCDIGRLNCFQSLNIITYISACLFKFCCCINM